MPKQHPKMDHKLCSLKQPWERRYWCRKLGVTAERLREAVKAVGRSTKALRAYMAKDRFTAES